MTLLDIRTQLVGLFCTKDTITPSDFGSIKIDPILQEHKDTLIRAGLDELCQVGLIRSAGDLWILAAPLNAAGQEVHLSMHTCNEIAEVINTDLEAKGITERVDPLNIQEFHILALLSILNEVLSTDPSDDDV